jgi:uncharacterized protein YabE (DUF348 family)
MKRQQLWAIAILMALLGITLAGLSLRKTVTLVIDGQSTTRTVMALTVGQALKAAGVSYSPMDRIAPRPSRILASGQAIRLDHALTYQVWANGASVTLQSPEKLPANVLAQAGLRLFPGDRVSVDGSNFAPSQPVSAITYAHTLQYHPAVAITLHLKKKTRIIYSAAPTLGEALWENGIKLDQADRLSMSSESPLNGPVQVSLLRAKPYTIHTAAGELKIRSAAATVGEALAEAGYPLQGLDYSRPAENDPLPEDGNIQVVRVAEEVTIQQKVIAYKTEYQSSSELAAGVQNVVSAGEYGLKISRLRVRYEDGKETSRQVDAEWVARQPKNEIVAYGGTLPVKSLDVAGGDLQYWYSLEMYATSYSPCRSGGSRCYPNTASGQPVQYGVAAVTVPWYRQLKGTQVYVPGYGVATILDTGGGIEGRYWIDLGYSDSDYQSWHQWVTVYFLGPPPAEKPSVLP